LLEEDEVGPDEAGGGFFGAAAAEFFVDASSEENASLGLRFRRRKYIGAGGSKIYGSVRRSELNYSAAVRVEMKF